MIHNFSILRVLNYFFAIVAVLVVGYLYESIPDATVQPQDFIISRGDTVATLPKKLHIDVNSFFYRLYVKFHYSSVILQAGTYQINKVTTLDDLFKTTLKNPTSKDLSVTILPGWNIFDIDAYLSKSQIAKTGEFIMVSENISASLRKDFPFLGPAKSLEGFLYPDTYRIKPDANADDIARVLLSEFEKKIGNDYFRSGNEKSFYESLVLASIVEKEERNTNNKPIVAGILKKRIEQNDRIGADATVCYFYRLSMDDCTPTFINNHVYDKTPYNTRTTSGLPPTPISNPSVDTFRATVSSLDTAYYYYLHDSDGQIHFARSLEEHNANKVKYLGK